MKSIDLERIIFQLFFNEVNYWKYDGSTRYTVNLVRYNAIVFANE